MPVLARAEARIGDAVQVAMAAGAEASLTRDAQPPPPSGRTGKVAIWETCVDPNFVISFQDTVPQSRGLWHGTAGT